MGYRIIKRLLANSAAHRCSLTGRKPFKISFWTRRLWYVEFDLRLQGLGTGRWQLLIRQAGNATTLVHPPRCSMVFLHCCIKMIIFDMRAAFDDARMYISLTHISWPVCSCSSVRSISSRNHFHFLCTQSYEGVIVVFGVADRLHKVLYREFCVPPCK